MYLIISLIFLGMLPFLFNNKIMGNWYNEFKNRLLNAWLSYTITLNKVWSWINFLESPTKQQNKFILCYPILLLYYTLVNKLFLLILILILIKNWCHIIIKRDAVLKTFTKLTPTYSQVVFETEKSAIFGNVRYLELSHWLKPRPLPLKQ